MQSSAVLQALGKIKEFSNATQESLEKIAYSAKEVIVDQGQTVVRHGTIETHGFILLEGSMRLLARDPISKDFYTVDRVTPGVLIGFVDLLRQESCEIAMARQKSRLISIPLELIAQIYEEDDGIRSALDGLQTNCEGAHLLSKYVESMNPPPQEVKKWVKAQLESSGKEPEDKDIRFLLSTNIQGMEHLVGKEMRSDMDDLTKGRSKFSLRYWKWHPTTLVDSLQTINLDSSSEKAIQASTVTDEMERASRWVPEETLDLERIGVREAKSNKDLEGFRIIKGKGAVKANLATLRMLARAYGTPCAVDVLEKVLEGAEARSMSIPIHGMGELAEMMGLQTQVGKVNIRKLGQLEFPVIIKLGLYYGLLTEFKKGVLKIADPEKGWVEIEEEKATKDWGEEIEVVLVKLLSDTPRRKFGWSWFSPVIQRFRWPLGQVVLASLFIQLFQLANPLLLQQIIDKVINQSNLSALQVLGGALVAAALFQGMLTAVRTWLLFDTTDRMDLILGTQVIDKLLRLPLRFFEKRPVGELSQRLGELGNLRGFLTGTAITSMLDLLFATIYIIIMLLYSPILTAVALCTIPLYILIIIFIAPVYRSLIRKQAQYAAATQSHLIETLGGIQTVKAQHFELNSRWKWQDRYSGQISEAFKSIVLGSTAGEVGNFLNQLSSLLIIWVGVYQVVNGELSLGQLIAFRIIAGYVTGPILRLSSLWQGFQQVSISMERLGDIMDQVPESIEKDHEQIALPPIKGEIKFDHVSFRFGKHGDYQVNGVDLEIHEGSFVGIVGQSGSGKSTLMKLLPRLYEPDIGRILIDGYDISKVSLSSVRQQIGIVPQECLLFEGTVRDNIAMNSPESDTDSIIKVAKASAAHDFIMELGEGYATRLGERGAGLSGGQRQRIAIARTLLQNPNLLILDEATSALDYDTEATVCHHLQQTLTNKTVLFITHRLSTVRNADKIILMHRGLIAEEGSHEELMNLGGRYASLYAHQGDA